MKKVYFIRTLMAISGILLLSSCVKEMSLNKGRVEPVINTINNSTPTVWFDWESADWMPTPISQSRIPSPWVGSGSLASLFGLDVINDRKAIDGWELLYSTFDANAPGNLENPYFVLYNKYRGIMRIFLYITTPFVATSSYLQDGLSIVSSSQTSLLNLLGTDMVDASQNQMRYSQMQPAPADGSLPLASNKWYMMEYELAYDSSISSIPYNQIQLSWYLNYYNVTKISLGGNIEGKLNGIIGVAGNSNPFAEVGPQLKPFGEAVLAGIGQSFLDKNATDASGGNKLGLPTGIFKSLKQGVSGALSSSVQNMPKAILGILSSIIGGSSSGPTPISLKLNASIKMEGTGTSSGSFPSSPISWWVPGTNISSSATGYIPLYNKILGVVNFLGKPNIYTSAGSYTFDDIDPYDGRVYTTTEYSLNLSFPIDYSSYLIINPEVLKIADVNIIKQDIVTIGANSYNGIREIGVNPIYYWQDPPQYASSSHEPSYEIGVRFTLEVKPKNGGASSVLVKTFMLNEVRS